MKAKQGLPTRGKSFLEEVYKQVNKKKEVFPENCWVGVTDDCRDSDTYPLDDFGEWITTTKKFISFEPLLGPLGTSIPVDVDQIIIGSMTGPRAVKPEKKWILDILDAANGKSIFLKDNLLKLFPDLPELRETAWVLK